MNSLVHHLQTGTQLKQQILNSYDRFERVIQHPDFSATERLALWKIFIEAMREPIAELERMKTSGRLLTAVEVLWG